MLLPSSTAVAGGAILAATAASVPLSTGPAAAQTVTVDISASGTNTGPVNPFEADVQFQFPLADLDMAGSGTVGSSANPLEPTFVDVNFDAFTTGNVGGSLTFLNGELDTFVFGGTSLGIGSVGLGADDFVVATGGLTGYAPDGAVALTGPFFSSIQSSVSINGTELF